MKVLTITTSYANNYGALLQTFALSKYLNNQEGIDCQVIQYYRPNADNSWVILKHPRTFRGVLKIIYTLFNLRLIRSSKRKNSKMKAFMKSYIPFTTTSWHTPDSIRKNPPEADAYICGSDQIWNMKYMFEGKTIYFLDFVKKGKRIAYAPSIADPWKPEHIELLRPYLEKFDTISIREKGNLEQVRKIYPKATVVIDPVFLLNKNDWQSFLKTELCPSEPYIFCYFLSVSDLSVKTVKRLRELTGLKVVHLNLNALDKFNSDQVIRVADPRDFVGLISRASLICTNSFHCSAFSTIFQKDFIFVPKNMANERVLNLQEVFGLGNRCISDERLKLLSLDDLNIDYARGEKSGHAFIDNSKKYLKEALYGKLD